MDSDLISQESPVSGALGARVCSVDSILDVRGLSKSYQVYSHPRDKIKELVWRGRRSYSREFAALSDVSFSLQRGEMLGIVGRNGSGKSTLLKLICGTLQPSSGEVLCQGRIGALLELGSGFDPEFNGLDNLYLNAALLGLTDQQIEDRQERIIAFAAIGDFIERPVKTYSSGMAMRLAFAIQVHTDPDLLIIDEALAVGDEIFKRRCMNRLQELKQAGTSIILVTHSSRAIVEHCNRAMLLVAGQMMLLDSPKIVVRVYERLGYAPDDQWPALLKRMDLLKQEQQPEELQALAPAGQMITTQPLPGCDYEPRGGEITRVEILDAQGQEVSVLPMGSAFSLRFHYQVSEMINQPIMGCNLSNSNGVLITGQTTSSAAGDPGCPACLEAGQWISRFYFDAGLRPGLYFVGCALSSNHPFRTVHKIRDMCFFRIVSVSRQRSFGYVDMIAKSADVFCVEP